MLDTETKRRIDSARDILVGKVPDPKSQVEQITIALIYKFMDDMDAEAVDLGGSRSFFTGEYEKYGWSKLFDPRLGGFEVLALYGEAIVRLNQNPHLPQLFRDIFKNAYLPYRDPETLKLFIKTINGFVYDHSERLGDAFEYLLSVLGSQGDAGQFRTPRHVIDFMVAAVNPQKGETVCDPACGTAGFLISAYKHILRQNTRQRSGDALTPDDKRKLMQAFVGYDISPDMVRLSLVNLYLHGFTAPRVMEYDTLTSEERWGEHFDVILANPPFMSPKGGIKPHKKFSVQANRSEALFVDYIAEHIHPVSGRAAVIVPEGVIFKAEGAFKSIRKLLVDKNYLYAVASLPAGVFQPYSGVKTSVLFLDKAVAKKSNNILFVKVEADGFDLGAQRRSVEKNDLPGALKALQNFKQAVMSGEEFVSDEKGVLVVEKERVKANADYNLSIERYREAGSANSKVLMVELGDVFVKVNETIEPQKFSGRVSYVGLENIESGTGCLVGDVEVDYQTIKSAKVRFREGDILYGKLRPNLNKVWLAQFEGICSTDIFVLRAKPEIAAAKLFAPYFRSDGFNEQVLVGLKGAQLPRVSYQHFSEIEIPLPPLSIQQQIVSKIEDYQRIIDGAKAVVQAYKPQMDIDPEWEMVALGEVIERLETGVSVNSEPRVADLTELGVLKTSAVTYGVFLASENKKVIETEISRLRGNPRKDSILISRMNTEALVGASAYVECDHSNLFLPDRLWQTIITRKDVSTRFIHLIISSSNYRKQISELCGGTSGSMKNISKESFLSIEVPLPSLTVQHQIVQGIEHEQRLVAANKELITLYEQKIKAEIARLWQAAPAAAVAASA